MTSRVVLLALSLLGCRHEASRAEEDAPPIPVRTATAAKATANPADPGPGEARSPADPGGPAIEASRYPLTGVTPVADGCPNAKVLVTSSPASPSPRWTFIRATLAAHPEFKIDGAGASGVTFQAAQTADGRSVQLVASCRSGATCNRLAATYHAVVPSSRPQVFCGDVPGVKGLRDAHLTASIPAANDDVMEKCARVGVCLRAANPGGADDPGLECQRAPSHFKLGCATEATCGEVAACLR